jgi:hypothetical protein
MDEVKIGNGFIGNIISKILKSTIRKKLGYDAEIQVNEINVSATNEKVHIHFNGDVELGTDELMRLLKGKGAIS